MKLTELLRPELVATRLEVRDKPQLLRRLVELSAASGRVGDIEAALAAVSEREAIMTTGIGGGIAIPHGKTDTVRELVGAFATITGTVEFDALDNQPVRLAFLLLGPPNATGPHIKMLSRISRVLNRETVGQQLSQADSPVDVIAIFREAENALFEL